MKKQKNYYNIQRAKDGYTVVDQTGKVITPTDVLLLTMKRLEALIRYDLNLEDSNNEKRND